MRPAARRVRARGPLGTSVQRDHPLAMEGVLGEERAWQRTRYTRVPAACATTTGLVHKLARRTYPPPATIAVKRRQHARTSSPPCPALPASNPHEAHRRLTGVMRAVGGGDQQRGQRAKDRPG